MLFKTLTIFATALTLGSGKAILDTPLPIRSDVQTPVQGPKGPPSALDERSATSAAPLVTEDATSAATTEFPLTTLDVDMTGTVSVVLPTVSSGANSSSSAVNEATFSTMAPSTTVTTLAPEVTTTDAMFEPAGNKTTSVEGPVKLTLTREVGKDKAVVKDEIFTTGDSSSESDETSSEEELAEGEESKYPEMTMTRNIKKGGAVIKDEVRNAGDNSKNEEKSERKERDLMLIENKESMDKNLETNQLRKGREDKDNKVSGDAGGQVPNFQATRGFTNDLAMIKDEVNMPRKERQAGGAVAASANAADIDARVNQGQVV